MICFVFELFVGIENARAQNIKSALYIIWSAIDGIVIIIGVYLFYHIWKPIIVPPPLNNVIESQLNKDEPPKVNSTLFFNNIGRKYYERNFYICR